MKAKAIFRLYLSLLTLAAALPLAAWEEYIVELDPEASWFAIRTDFDRGEGKLRGWAHVVVDAERNRIWIPSTYTLPVGASDSGPGRSLVGQIVGGSWDFQQGDFLYQSSNPCETDRFPTIGVTGYCSPATLRLQHFFREVNDLGWRTSLVGKMTDDDLLRIKDVFPTATWNPSTTLRFEGFLDPTNGFIHTLDVFWFPTVESRIHGFWGYVQPGPSETQFWAWDTMLDAWLLVDTANSSWIWSSRHGWLEFVDYQRGEVFVDVERRFVRADDGTELVAPANTSTQGISWRSFIYPKQHPMRP